MRPWVFSGPRLFALPMYSVPFTTVGEELTMGSPVSPLQISVHTNAPHPAAGQASTSLVFTMARTNALQNSLYTPGLGTQGPLHPDGGGLIGRDVPRCRDPAVPTPRRRARIGLRPST